MLLILLLFALVKCSSSQIQLMDLSKHIDEIKNVAVGVVKGAEDVSAVNKIQNVSVVKGIENGVANNSEVNLILDQDVRKMMRFKTVSTFRDRYFQS